MGSYWKECAAGNAAVWSICGQKEGAEERENVLTVGLDIESRSVTQARGTSWRAAALSRIGPISCGACAPGWLTRRTKPRL